MEMHQLGLSHLICLVGVSLHVYCDTGCDDLCDVCNILAVADVHLQHIEFLLAVTDTTDLGLNNAYSNSCLVNRKCKDAAR